MTLKSLKIEHPCYGPNKDKFIAVVQLQEPDNHHNSISLELSPEASLRLLAVAREELILATHDAATELEIRLRQSIPSPALLTA
jgi:hypothetical protein